MARYGVTDTQRERIREHLPTRPKRPQGCRPPADDRKCFEGVLWITWTGSPWAAMPKPYGSSTTCWRRLQEWEEGDVFLYVWRNFLAEHNDTEKIRWDECVADGSFAPAKRGRMIGNTKRGNGTKWMVVADGEGTPLGDHPDSTAPAVVT